MQVAGRYRLPDRLQESGEPNRVPSPVASRGQLDISTLSPTLTSLHLRECLINKVDLRNCSVAKNKLSPLPGDNLSPCRGTCAKCGSISHDSIREEIATTEQLLQVYIAYQTTHTFI
jgi:hypothetical protein